MSQDSTARPSERRNVTGSQHQALKLDHGHLPCHRCLSSWPMQKQASFPRPLVIVLGGGDVGSAVALALHQAGFALVLVDEADPSWHRRGMGFTNAWYVGNAELESEGACFCASLKSIPSILARRMIAATTWSWPGVAAMLDS